LNRLYAQITPFETSISKEPNGIGSA